MTVQIKSIKIFTAFKVGAILSALMFVIGVVPVMLLQGLFLGVAAVGSTTATYQQSSQGFDPSMLFAGGLGIAGICVGIGLGTVMYGVFGGIGAAIAAFVYNLTSGWVGGIEVDLKRIRLEAAPARKSKESV